jgi:hypothetical protein
MLMALFPKGEIRNQKAEIPAVPTTDEAGTPASV